jgi:hypothetical protein
VQYFTSYYALKPAKTRKVHISKRFDDISELDCWIKFRTRKRDLPRLLRALKLDGQTFNVAYPPGTFRIAGFMTTPCWHVLALDQSQIRMEPVNQTTYRWRFIMAGRSITELNTRLWNFQMACVVTCTVPAHLKTTILVCCQILC